MNFLYEVSTWGRVKTLPRLIRRGTGYWLQRAKILKPRERQGKKPYQTVPLTNEKHERSSHYVHRLVLETFIGPCPEGMEAHHFPDPDPQNNRLENLSWSPKAQNQGDRHIHGTDGKGERNARAKLTDKQVSYIRRSQKSLGELSRQLKVNKQTICKVRLRQSWTHIE
jgi:hypothetical protein